MENYSLKVEALYEMQGHACAITGRHLMAGMKWDLHHAGIADSKRKAVVKKYRELLHSLLNLELVDHEAHMQEPLARHWPLHIADKLERRLRENKDLADLLNCRRIPAGVDWQDVAVTKRLLLEEVGAIDTSYRDRIIELAFAKRVSA